MNCSICLEPCAKRLTCPKCEAITCHACQAQYGVPACANCQQPFTKYFFLKSNAKQLVKTVYRPWQETVFWDREKALLANTQVLVDWEVKVEALKKRLRFGEHVRFPPKPTVHLSAQANVFPCPLVSCRGFVSHGKCALCKLLVCTKCREADGANHCCNPDTLHSLQQILADSKACPSCAAIIFRTEGCNHMFCTNCRTHFNYETLQILRTSTNHHYDNTQRFATNVATLARSSEQACQGDPTVHAVYPPAHVDTSGLIYKMLYFEAVTARFMLQSKFDPTSLQREHQESLIQLRIDFLRQKLTEPEAKAKVFTLEQQFEKKLHYSTLLSNFLVALNDCQRIWKEHDWKPDDSEVLELVRTILQVSQDTATAISEEYGGAVLRFNTDFQTNSKPVVSF